MPRDFDMQVASNYKVFTMSQCCVRSGYRRDWRQEGDGDFLAMQNTHSRKRGRAWVFRVVRRRIECRLREVTFSASHIGIVATTVAAMCDHLQSQSFRLSAHKFRPVEIDGTARFFEVAVPHPRRARILCKAALRNVKLMRQYDDVASHWASQMVV